MATKCELCGKHTMFGRNIRHQHTGRWERKAPRTNRLFKANVQIKTLVAEAKPMDLQQIETMSYLVKGVLGTVK